MFSASNNHPEDEGLSVWCRHNCNGDVNFLAIRWINCLLFTLNRKLFSKTKILELSDNIISACVSFECPHRGSVTNPWNVNKWKVNKIPVYGSLMFLCDALGMNTSQTWGKESRRSCNQKLLEQQEGQLGGEWETNLLSDSWLGVDTTFKPFRPRVSVGLKS